MSEWKERLQEQLTAEYKPDAAMDAKLQRGTAWINQLPPLERMELGRYQARKEAFEQQQRTARAEAAKAARMQSAVTD